MTVLPSHLPTAHLPASRPHPVPPLHPPARSTRAERRNAIRDGLLDSLEELVARHRALARGDHADLHAELIAAEVAHQLELTRSRLRRTPHLRPAPEPEVES